MLKRYECDLDTWAECIERLEHSMEIFNKRHNTCYEASTEITNEGTIVIKIINNAEQSN